MKALPKAVIMKIVLFVWFLLMFAIHSERTFAMQEQDSSEMITEWQMKWGDQTELEKGPHSIKTDEGWSKLNVGDTLPEKPYSDSTAWIKIQIPSIIYDSPGMLLNNILGQNIIIYLDEKDIFLSHRRYMYDKNNIFLPLNVSDEGKTMYIGIQSLKDKVGLQEPPRIGNSAMLVHQFSHKDLINIMLGCAFLFIAIIIFICSIFIKRAEHKTWVSLSLIVASLGILVLTYSPFLYTFYDDYGDLYLKLLDIALFVLFPSLTYFVKNILGPGNRSILTKFFKFQWIFSISCFICLLINLLMPGNSFEIYYKLMWNILGAMVFGEVVYLMVYCLLQALRGDRNAIFLAIGFSVLGLTGVTEITWFFIKSGSYDLFMWKWGAAAFIISLILVLGRSYSSNHDQVLKYSKELEMFNIELQRSEKMAIISEMAASVAHEVRNPLQVTRGFLQQLTRKYNKQEKIYITMAIEELDRAASIITDFLTFAKPEFDRITVLSVNEELMHVEGIMMPLANVQGGHIQLNIPDDLRVNGNSSKFKQAFVNMIKNSIEALNGEGEINIWAYKLENQAVIHIQDNGKGMNAEELTKLGEPYFSSNTKGTGLGLMVSYRIIEVMDGSIEFKSEKGMGTEAIIRLPAVRE